MFTGIIETIGTVQGVQKQGANLIFTVHSPISQELQIDQSVSHNGACLTVVGIQDHAHRVIAVAETLQKTTLSSLQRDDKINLERAMTLQKRLDGHMIQGHVDAVGACIDRLEKDGSIELVFDFPEKFAPLVIEKGSIGLDGISLTVFDVTRHTFRVAVIPYTLEHTTIKYLRLQSRVNLEFDLIGKYVARTLLLKEETSGASSPQKASA